MFEIHRLWLKVVIQNWLGDARRRHMRETAQRRSNSPDTTESKGEERRGGVGVGRGARENRNIWVKGPAKENNEGDVDMAAANWRKGEGTCVGRGMQKNDQRENGKRKGKQNDPEIEKPNEKPNEKLTSYS